MKPFSRDYKDFQWEIKVEKSWTIFICKYFHHNLGKSPKIQTNKHFIFSSHSARGSGNFWKYFSVNRQIKQWLSVRLGSPITLCLPARVEHSHWSRYQILCCDWLNLTMLAPRSKT